MRSWGSLVAILVGLCALLIGGAVLLAQQTPAQPRFHDDAQAVKQAALDATLALFRDDAPATKKALDALAKQCRRLNPEEEGAFGADIVSTDEAYHLALARTREHAGRKDTKNAFDQYFWVQRICRDCHGLARKRGLLPAEGPLW